MPERPGPHKTLPAVGSALGLSGYARPSPVQVLTIELDEPFRLDLTVWALRRRAHNAIDRWDGSTYRDAVRENQPVVCTCWILVPGRGTTEVRLVAQFESSQLLGRVLARIGVRGWIGTWHRSVRPPLPGPSRRSEADQLRVDQRSRRRIGRQKRRDEVLAGAEHELGDAAQEGEMQR